MVIPDWNAISKAKAPRIDVIQEVPLWDRPMAMPTERLAAVILDVFVLLTPLFFMISAPIKRWLTAAFILGAESDFFFNIGILVAVATAMIISYQTACSYYFGATAGKRIVGLKVVSVYDDRRLSFWRSFLRALTWTAEALLLGLPWLSVFSNRFRRPLHDRVADTMVVRVGAPVRGAPTPEAWERGLVRGVFSAALTVFAFIAFVETKGIAERMNVERSIWPVTSHDMGECEVVSQNWDEPPEILPGMSSLSLDRNDQSRLKMAMSLYAAGLADRSCLESEVEREVSTQVPVNAITYLAQAFVYADDADVSNAYLDKVCADAPGSSECSMSQLVSSWSNEDWPSVDSILRTAPKGSGYLEIWGVRHYMKQAQYATALSLLDDLTSRREIMEFNLTQRVKALYNSYHETEAVEAYKQALVALPNQDGKDLGAWMCAQQLQAGCSAAQSIACRQVTQEDGVDGGAGVIDFENPSEALARVLVQECRPGAAMDYGRLAGQTRDENWRNFFRANQLAQKSKSRSAADLYARVASSDSAPDAVRVEALRRMSTAVNPSQAEILLELWNGLESKEAWVKAGNILFGRLAQFKDRELAYRVARHLMNLGSLSPKGMTLLAAMVEKPEREGRAPASVPVRDQVRHLLDSLEDGNGYGGGSGASPSRPGENR